MSDRWDRHFLHLAIEHARMSKDTATRVGSVIVGPDREIRSAGFNGFPRGIADTPERLADRETKLKLIVHGEMNAVLAAARCITHHGTANTKNTIARIARAQRKKPCHPLPRARRWNR